MIEFPDPMDTPDDGLVAVGGNLKPETLLAAYKKGIFPWPMPGYPFTWFFPKERAVLHTKKFHVSKSLERFKKKNPYRLSVDKAFDQVIEQCAKVPRKEKGTWITPELLKAYNNLHRLGFAHSVEAWVGDDLVGGVYGVKIERYFSAESMFHTASNASKLCLEHLLQWLKAQGTDWIDIQVMTPHMKSMGAEIVSRKNFVKILNFALNSKA